MEYIKLKDGSNCMIRNASSSDAEAVLISMDRVHSETGFLLSYPVEIEVVSTNTGAITLYKNMGFTEYGRNPKRFKSRYSEWQELILMKRKIGILGDSN